MNVVSSRTKAEPPVKVLKIRPVFTNKDWKCVVVQNIEMSLENHSKPAVLYQLTSMVFGDLV